MILAAGGRRRSPGTSMSCLCFATISFLVSARFPLSFRDCSVNLPVGCGVGRGVAPGDVGVALGARVGAAVLGARVGAAVLGAGVGVAVLGARVCAPDGELVGDAVPV